MIRSFLGVINSLGKPSDLGLFNLSLDDGVHIVINTVFGALAAVAVFFIIKGGIKYTVSGGDPAGVKTAKETILYAIIGLIVALLAFGAVNFITGKAGTLN